MDFTVTITEKEAREALAKTLTVDEWLELFEINSNTYSSWEIDLQIAEALVKKVKEGYIDKYREEVPEALRPLLIQAISDNIVENNKRNKDVTLEDVSGEVELKAIERLRDFSTVNYSDAINLFCDGYDFALEDLENTTLSEVSTEELLTELKNRTF